MMKICYKYLNKRKKLLPEIESLTLSQTIKNKQMKLNYYVRLKRNARVVKERGCKLKLKLIVSVFKKCDVVFSERF